jgi:hypothetical protein
MNITYIDAWISYRVIPISSRERDEARPALLNLCPLKVCGAPRGLLSAGKQPRLARVSFTPRFLNLTFRFPPFDCISLLPAPNSDYIWSLPYEDRRWLMEAVRSEKAVDWALQGSEQGGEQSRRQHRSVNPTPPQSPRWPVSSGTPPAEIRAENSLRRGTACCARCSVADERYALANSRSISAVAPMRQFQLQPLPYIPPLPPQFGRETGQLSGISNRNWPTNRSYTKHTTKPRLTGTRIARGGFRNAGLSRAQSRGVSPALLSLEFAPLPPQAVKNSSPARRNEGSIARVSNRELLELEIPQRAENKHRHTVLIENFEPNHCFNFRASLQAEKS